MSGVELAAGHPLHPMIIRQAQMTDIPGLVELENRCFDTDRLSRRNFQHLLGRGHAVCLVADTNTRLAGYSLLLFREGTSLARLYSFAVDPDFRGQGIAHQLLAASEDEARSRDTVYLRLEVRRDNEPAIRLYRSHGYHEFGVLPEYYDDLMDALRMEKRLAATGGPEPSRVPYYRQTLDFTCGPAALMMGMKKLDPRLEMSRRLEIRLWREATTIFMTSGTGGCSPRGLALAARRRGFEVELYISDDRPLFVDSVRSEEKKEILRLVHEEYRDDVAAVGIPVHYRPLSLDELENELAEGAAPIVLISSYRIYHEKNPHWVLVTGADAHFVYAHDPFVDVADGKTASDSINLPIPRKAFERMARYGRSQLKAAVVLRPSPGRTPCPPM